MLILVTLSPMPSSETDILTIIDVMKCRGFTERGWADVDTMKFDGPNTNFPLQTLARRGVTSINVKIISAP